MIEKQAFTYCRDLLNQNIREHGGNGSIHGGDQGNKRQRTK